MYRAIRNIHLMTGLACCLFLLMYAVSGVQMSHNNWFDMKPTVTETLVPVDPSAATSPRALAAELMRAHGLRGEITRANAGESGYEVTISRPGTVVEARYIPGAPDARLETSKARFMGLMNRMHHVNGLWHDDAVFNVWGGFVGLVSLALLVLGGTGVYLWFKICDERLIGGLILSLGLFVGLGLLAAMRMQS